MVSRDRARVDDNSRPWCVMIDSCEAKIALAWPPFPIAGCGADESRGGAIARLDSHHRGDRANRTVETLTRAANVTADGDDL